MESVLERAKAARIRELLIKLYSWGASRSFQRKTQVCGEEKEGALGGLTEKVVLKLSLGGFVVHQEARKTKGLL